MACKLGLQILGNWENNVSRSAGQVEKQRRKAEWFRCGVEGRETGNPARRRNPDSKQTRQGGPRPNNVDGSAVMEHARADRSFSLCAQRPKLSTKDSAFGDSVTQPSQDKARKSKIIGAVTHRLNLNKEPHTWRVVTRLCGEATPDPQTTTTAEAPRTTKSVHSDHKALSSPVCTPHGTAVYLIDSSGTSGLCSQWSLRAECNEHSVMEGGRGASIVHKLRLH